MKIIEIINKLAKILLIFVNKFIIYIVVVNKIKKKIKYVFKRFSFYASIVIIIIKTLFQLIETTFKQN